MNQTKGIDPVTKTLVLNLEEKTFQLLEVLAFGLNIEKFPNDENSRELINGYNDEGDHFAPLVSRLLEDIAESLAAGVQRPGFSERDCLESLTGWQGTLNRGMFGPLVDIPDG